MALPGIWIMPRLSLDMDLTVDVLPPLPAPPTPLPMLSHTFWMSGESSAKSLSHSHVLSSYTREIRFPIQNKIQ